MVSSAHYLLHYITLCYFKKHYFKLVSRNSCCVLLCICLFDFEMLVFLLSLFFFFIFLWLVLV